MIRLTAGVNKTFRLPSAPIRRPMSAAFPSVIGDNISSIPTAQGHRLVKLTP